MKYKKHTYFRQVITIITLCLTVLMSCFHDDALEMCEEKGLIILNLGVDGMSTRAAGDQLFAGDEAITKVRIFVFVGDALEVNRLYSIGESQFNNPFVLEVATGLKDIYVVANESGALSTELASVTSKSQLTELMVGQTLSPLNLPLIMTGSESGINVIEQLEPLHNNVDISLTRVAAKISMRFKKDTDANVSITKISLLKNSENTTLWDNGAITSDITKWDWNHILTTPLVLTSTATAVSGYENIYLFENLAGELNKDKATQLEVEALYNGIQTKYRVYINEDISSPGTGNPGDPDYSDVGIKTHYYNIWRNYHYQLTGTISGLREYTTISVQVKILPWTVHEYPVILE